MSERCVIIVAGGKGLRMGGDLPKQFIPMAGKPVLMHTLEAFHRWDPKARLVLVLPKSQQDYWAMLVREIGCRAPHEVAGRRMRWPMAVRHVSIPCSMGFVVCRTPFRGTTDRSWWASTTGCVLS